MKSNMLRMCGSLAIPRACCHRSGMRPDRAGANVRVTYFSNETGTFEVYVRPFPGPGPQTRISTGGGQWPIWSRNAAELFFVAPDRRIMVASYTAKTDSFVAGKPQVWSEKRLMVAAGPVSYYDLAPDGKRFAAVLYPDGTAEEKPRTHLTFLLNLFDDLRQRFPAGGK